MQRSRIVVGMLSVGMMVLAAGVVSSQNYPNKPIRIVTVEPGGGLDIAARLIAQNIAGPLGQPVIVDNRGGAGGIIAAEYVAKAPADGYTLLFQSSALWLLPFMRDKVPYDPVRDFSPITLVAISPNVVVVHPSLPVKSVKELIVLAKAHPGELNYGSGGLGALNYVAAELFRAMAGINIVHIPYKGAAPAFVDLIGGQLQLMFPTAGSAVPYIKSGKLKGLAVTSAQPSAVLPGLPTVTATGLAGYESTSIWCLFAPAGTPVAPINRLNQEVVAFLNGADVKGRFLSAGSEVVASSPEQLATTMKSEMARLGKIIRDAGIRAE